MSEKLVLIDGNSIMNRAFFGVPTLTNGDGFPTNAIYGFVNILLRILDEEKADYLVVAFDVKAPTFRHEIYAEYKGTRKPMPEDLCRQWPVLKELLAAMDVCLVEKAGLEGDDILGTIARMGEARGMEVSLVSGDRDLLQIASDKVMIRIPKTKAGKTEIYNYHKSDVVKEYGLRPDQIIELKALMGDSSDNIPGVPKIGKKTATELILEYDNIENLENHISEISKKSIRETLENNFELAKLSKVLATIDTNAEFEFSFEAACCKNLFTKDAYSIMKTLGFKNLLPRFDLKAEDNAADFISLCTINEVNELLNEIKALSPKVVGFDIFNDGRIVGASVCLSREKAYYIFTGDEISETFLSDFISRMILSAEKTVFVTFDTKKLYHIIPGLADFDTASHRLFDTSIGAYLLNPLKSDYDIADIASENGEIMKSYYELFGKKPISEAALSKEEFTEFACMSAYTEYTAYERIISRLEEEKMLSLFKDIEMPLALCLYYMEEAGIRIKPDELTVYGNELGKSISTLEKEIHEKAGVSFNINSPKQLGEVLFEKMGLEGGKKTKTGYSTAADILEKLAPDYPIVGDILEYRGLTKLKSTYADGLASYIGADDRIHSTFNQTITATGRISSNEPNLQNIPIRTKQGRLIRKLFIPKDGCVFIDADYSQIELRVVAHMSQDEKLIEAFNNGEDIHRSTASKVFKVPFEEVTDLQRRNAKAVNFGIIYGISSFGLSQDLNISTKDAKNFIERYFETFPKVKSFLDDLVSDAKEKGYVVTMCNRRRPMPELKAANFIQRSFGERVAMNAPVQGTAADIIKIAMIKVVKRMKAEGLKSRLILQVHDELLIEALIEEKEIVEKILKEEMENAISLSVKLVVDMHSGYTWYEAK